MVVDADSGTAEQPPQVKHISASKSFILRSPLDDDPYYQDRQEEEAVSHHVYSFGDITVVEPVVPSTECVDDVV